jgi:hypothetical protein
LIEAFQFSVPAFFHHPSVYLRITTLTPHLQDEHGEVCPAGWKAGFKTIKADPKGSLEYFSTTGTSEAPSNKRPRTE